MARGIAQAINIDGVEYPSKMAAAYALFEEQGWTAPQVGTRLDMKTQAVHTAVAKVRKKLRNEAPATAKAQWTPEKRDKVRRLFGKTMVHIADAVQVPAAELLRYVLHGVVPPSQDIKNPDDIRWSEGQAPQIERLALLPAHPPAQAFEQFDEAIDADHLVEPDREDDEAELARLDAEDASDKIESPTVIQEPPAAPASRFQDPAPAPARTVAGSGVAAPAEVLCLVDEMGRYLHESLDGMTTNPRYAWKGGQDKLTKIQKQLPHLRQLDAVPFQK